MIKHVIIWVVCGLALVSVAYSLQPTIVQAQGETPVVSPVETPAPDEPGDDVGTELPPPLVEAVQDLIKEGGGWLNLQALAVLGMIMKYVTGWLRKRFPKDARGTVTKINGGIADIFAGLGAVTTALIGFVVAWALGFVSSGDPAQLLQGILELAGVAYVGGLGMHLKGKVSTIARESKKA